MSHPNYPILIQSALKDVIRQVLILLQNQEIDSPLYLTFDTTKADIPDFLRPSYPDEMTIVLEHQFQNLKVTENCFQVELSFSGKPALLTVPFASLLSFVDASCDFMLTFETKKKKAASIEMNTPTPEPHQAEIISLDELRKKKS